MTAMETTDVLDVLRAELARTQFAVLNPPDGLQGRAELRKSVSTLHAALSGHPELQLKAQVLMRRAERLLAAAAIEALAKGEVITAKTRPREGVRYLTDFMSAGDWTNGRIRRLALATDEQFEQALNLCLAGGSAALTPLLRLLPAPRPYGRMAPSRPYAPGPQRKFVIEQMAREGHSASSIARELGISPGRVSELARRNNIVIRADRLLRNRSRVIDAENVIETTINSLEDLASGLTIIDDIDINPGLAKLLAKNLSAALRPFTKLQRQLMEEN